MFVHRKEWKECGIQVCVREREREKKNVLPNSDVDIFFIHLFHSFVEYDMVDMASDMASPRFIRYNKLSCLLAETPRTPGVYQQDCYHLRVLSINY